MKGVSLPLGFTFSFPCQQNNLDEVTPPLLAAPLAGTWLSLLPGIEGDSLGVFSTTGNSPEVDKRFQGDGLRGRGRGGPAEGGHSQERGEQPQGSGCSHILTLFSIINWPVKQITGLSSGLMSVGIFTAALTHHLRLDFQTPELQAGPWPGLEQTCLALSSGDTGSFPRHRPPRAPAQGLLLAGLTQPLGSWRCLRSEPYLQTGGAAGSPWEPPCLWRSMVMEDKGEQF